MKVITEATVREQLKNSSQTQYNIPENTILSPAAKEYLQGRKIRVTRNEVEKTSMNNYAEHKYIDYESGAYFIEKPEHMTQLFGKFLVAKSHPRIIFRGKLDSASALLVLSEAELKKDGANAKIIADLCDIGRILSEIMRAEVLDEPLNNSKIIGYTHEELHARSHDPKKFFGVEQMQLPSYEMGVPYARLNFLRTQIRELETAANVAFCEQKEQKTDVLRELNRLSSALHVMMCKLLAGEYR